MIRHNNLIVEIYSGTTKIPDPRGEITRNSSDIAFSSGYPAGRYLTGSFHVPRKILDQWSVSGAQRVVFRNGQKIVFEGYIDDLEAILDATTQGVTIPLVGAWDVLLGRRVINKPWSDNRITENVWRTDITIDLEDWNIERSGRIHISPNTGAFTNADYLPLVYTAPVGQTVKRIVCHEDFSEKAGQDWKMSIWRSTDGSSYTEMTSGSGETYADGTTTVLSATGNDDIDVTLATPSRYVQLRMTSNGNNTVAARDHNHAQWTNLVVYTETSAINISEIAADVVGLITTLNSSTAQIDSITQDLTPFISDNLTAADVIIQAAEGGDGSGGKVGYGLLPSGATGSSDGKPVLFVEAYPALTDYDYTLRLDEQNIVPAVSIIRSYRDIWNDIIVTYQDENGMQTVITSTDEPTLTDSTSVAAYGTRQYVLALGYSTHDVALANGVRFLAAKKDPQYIVTSPITVSGYIRAKNGNNVPSSEITPGKRLRLENYNPELILLITGTTYDDNSQTTSMSFGFNNEPWMQMLTAPTRMGMEPASEAGSASSGEIDRLNWRRKWSKEFSALGIDPWTDKRSKNELIRLAKEYKKRRG